MCAGSRQGLIDIVNVLHYEMKDLPGDRVWALPLLTSG